MLQLDERFEPLGPGSPPDRYDFYNMDDQQLAARMTALLAELTALTAEVTLRLGASDTRGRAETPAQTGRAQPPARTGRYDYVITMEDLERLEADGGKSDDGRSSTG